MASEPSFKKRERGRRLIKKASFTAVLGCERDQSGLLGAGSRVVKIGKINTIKITTWAEVRINAVEGIIGATAWICTKSFWFLRPTDALLSFRSRASRAWEFNPGGGG